MRRDLVEIDICTQKDISDVQYADKLLRYCQECGLQFRKVGTYQPLRNDFTPELFRTCWCTKSTGKRYTGEDYVAGGVIASLKGTTGGVMADWKITSRDNIVVKGIVYNWIHIWFSYKFAQSHLPQIERLYLDLITEFEPEHAHMGTEAGSDRGIYVKKPLFHQSIQWCTYLSKEHMAEIREKFDQIPWPYRQELEQGTWIKLSELPPKEGDPLIAQCIEYNVQLWGLKTWKMKWAEDAGPNGIPYSPIKKE